MNGGRSRSPGPALLAPIIGAAVPRAIDYFDVQGVVERACQALRVSVHMEGVAEPWLVPGRGAAIAADGVRIGAMGLLASSIIEQHELSANDAVFVAEIDLDSVPPVNDDLQVQPLPRHPSMTRDISILVADTLAAGTVRQTVQEHAPDTLIRVSEFDRYQGKGIPDGQVSLSLRLTFRAPDRTLTDGEVQKAVDGVLAALKPTAQRGATLARSGQLGVDQLRDVVAPSPPHSQSKGTQRMAKQAVAARIDLDPIDRLEEKVKLLVSVVAQLRREHAKVLDDNSRLIRELDSMRSRLAENEVTGSELSSLREERELIRARVAEMLEQLEAI